MSRQHPKRFENQTSTRPRKWVNSNSSNEYLNLYNKIDVASGTLGLALYDTRGSGKWVRTL